MKHTKDEIEITITKKDRVYLSIILSLICIVAIVCILVPRYYQLQNDKPTNPNNSQTGNTHNPNEPNTNNSTQTGVSLNSLYQNAYTTIVLNQLKPLGMPYSTLSNHLDSFNILDVVGLNINSSQLDNLETLSLPIYEAFTDYTNNNIQITTELINSNDLLHSQIIALSNAFTQILQR